jgi:hypothetical protein
MEVVPDMGVCHWADFLQHILMVLAHLRPIQDLVAVEVVVAVAAVVAGLLMARCGRVFGSVCQELP